MLLLALAYTVTATSVTIPQIPAMPALVYSLTNWLMTWTNLNNTGNGFKAVDIALGINDTYAID
jgi:hypothetical protein